MFSPDTLEEATRKAALGLAAEIPDREEAKRVEAWGKDLATFFHNHVHPTRIVDFRAWVRKEGLFHIQCERHWGPRPIGQRRLAQVFRSRGVADRKLWSGARPAPK